MSGDYNIHEQKMRKTVEVLNTEFASIRAGRANPAVLDRLTIEYYGSQTPIAQVASISSPEARTLVIQPWDASATKAIEKSINASDLGINPQNDGKVIRLVFPPLTEERRRDLAKQIHKLGEDAKIAIRNIRREAMDGYKAAKKKSEITEDDLKSIEKDIQELTDSYISEVESVSARKEIDITSV